MATNIESKEIQEVVEIKVEDTEHGIAEDGKGDDSNGNN